VSNSKKIYEELKLSIMEGKYKPREPLLERALAAQFGVSRTPIREAFRRLEAIGMVKKGPKQGVRVADFSQREIEDLYLVRLHLKQLAVKLAVRHVSSQDIKALKEINQELLKAFSRFDVAAMIEENYKFHRTLIAISKNPFLMQFIEILRSRSYIVAHRFWGQRENLRFHIQEHNQIIRALEKCDFQKSFSLLKAHLSKSRDYFMREILKT